MLPRGSHNAAKGVTQCCLGGHTMLPRRSQCCLGGHPVLPRGSPSAAYMYARYYPNIHCSFRETYLNCVGNL